jgi:phosphoglycolate phosphatase
MSAPRREDLVVAVTVLYTLGHKWREAKRLAEDAYEMADELFFSDYSPSPMEGAEDALKRLKRAGFKLAIATNDRRSVAERVIRAMGLKDLFDVVVGADDVENSKPAPDMVFLVCELCGIEPQQAVFFGDLPRDMEAGRAAGIGGLVAVRSNLVPKLELDGLADCFIDSFEEIIITG